jgi:hypothetical protein
MFTRLAAPKLYIIVEMASTDSYFNNARQAIDIAVAQNIDNMRRDGTLNNYVARSRDQLVKQINEAQMANGAKVMQDLGRSIDVQRANYYYFKRNSDLLNVADVPLKTMERDAAALRHDNQNAQRQYEINQWTSGNRQDTLFVYQIIFISVLVLAIFTGLWRAGIVGTGFLSLLTFMLLIVIVLVIINRAQYTAFTRDQRYWNKRHFPKFTGPVIPIPDCPTVTDTITGLQSTVTQTAQSIGSQARSTAADALSSLSTSLGAAAAATR